MSKKVLVVGIATVDVVNVVEHYPQEDAEVRALEQHIRRGGNGANTSVVLAQQGHQVEWLGNLADDPNAQIIKHDFHHHGVGFNLAPSIKNSVTPTSYISQSRSTGSRTIVHYRRLPELRDEDVGNLPWSQFDWVHFEGRNESLTLELMRQISRIYTTNRPMVSVEIEKVRNNELDLIQHADQIFVSRDYVLKKGFQDAKAFHQTLSVTPQQSVIIPWGQKGAYAFKQKDYFNAAEEVGQVIDSVGAGDTFIAGFIHAQLKGETIKESLFQANRLAAMKLRQQGFAGLTI